MLEDPVCKVFHPIWVNFPYAEPRNNLILLSCSSAQTSMLRSLMFLSLCLVTYADTYRAAYICRYLAESFSLQSSPRWTPTEFSSCSPQQARDVSSRLSALPNCSVPAALLLLLSASFLSACAFYKPLSWFPFLYTSSASQLVSPILSLALGPPILLCSAKWLPSLPPDGRYTSYRSCFYQ